MFVSAIITAFDFCVVISSFKIQNLLLQLRELVAVGYIAEEVFLTYHKTLVKILVDSGLSHDRKVDLYEA